MGVGFFKHLRMRRKQRPNRRKGGHGVSSKALVEATQGNDDESVAATNKIEMDDMQGALSLDDSLKRSFAEVIYSVRSLLVSSRPVSVGLSW